LREFSDLKLISPNNFIWGEAFGWGFWSAKKNLKTSIIFGSLDLIELQMGPDLDLATTTV
jgi:hypothetical protein